MTIELEWTLCSPCGVPHTVAGPFVAHWWSTGSICLQLLEGTGDYDQAKQLYERLGSQARSFGGHTRCDLSSFSASSHIDCVHVGNEGKLRKLLSTIEKQEAKAE